MPKHVVFALQVENHEAMNDETNALKYQIGLLKGKVTQKDRKIVKLEKQISEMKIMKKPCSKNSKEELSYMVLDLQRENYMLRHRIGEMEMERFIENMERKTK